MADKTRADTVKQSAVLGAARQGLLILAVGFATVGCDLPRDCEGTLQHVRGGRLRVGLVEQSPWVIRAAPEPRGAEVELVRQLAAELGARPEWFWGGEEQHMEALEQFELDLVVGGLTKKSPWKNRVGFTQPYFKDRIVVGVAEAPPPVTLRGMHISVKNGEADVAHLENKGAVPVQVADVRSVAGAVAAADWELEALELQPSQFILRTRQHVFAVPPGENAWIKRLEEFLTQHKDEIKQLLQHEVVHQ